MSKRFNSYWCGSIMFAFIGFLTSACQPEKPSLFETKSQQAGITFSNEISYTEDFNPYTYKSFFNGGGVALGDINNDGLLDIYFTGNLVDNKLYLNKGNWEFEDITDAAGVSCPNVWSSGATFVDINADGLLDLYVCKSGKPEGENRNNELFINQGDLTFKEASKAYGLDITGLSTHAAFFDYDKDGDLDCYILTNSVKSVGGYDLIEDQREVPDPLNGGNKFLVNHDQYFYDSTLSKGVYSSEIGFGLGITLTDFNNDDWTDIYVSNDFFERDYLYINQQGNGFKESLVDYFGSISMGSMGADAADLNNDLLPDLFVTEMLPTKVEHQRTKTIFESWDKHQLSMSKGYYTQYPRNVLQMNTVNDKFIEVGRYGDVSATDWSWGALMFDFDNDGLRDIFVSNGILKDLLDRDYLTYATNDQEIGRILREKGSVITELLEAMPTTPVPNRAFINQGNFVFAEHAKQLGLGGNSYSNGSAYGDLDNDGDYDLVVNNVNQVASLYENHSDETTNNYLSITLIGQKENLFAIGARVVAYANDQTWLTENFPSRGFQSSVDNKLIIGLGDIAKIDSVRITWPDGKRSKLIDLASGSYVVTYDDQPNKELKLSLPKKHQTLTRVELMRSIKHQENDFVDFDRDRLLPMMMHNEGPGFLVEDLNGDNIPEVALGGAKNSTMQLMEVISEANFQDITGEDMLADAISEDNIIKTADFNGDGFSDLYVGSAGKAFSKSSSALSDRIYLNDGQNNFVKVVDAIPTNLKFSTGAATIADFDGDQDMDLFISERFHPFYYTDETASYLLLNDGTGHFTDVSDDWLAGVELPQMATDGESLDYNMDGLPDAVITTDWGALVLLENTGSSFVNVSAKLAPEMTGWWSAVKVIDIDGDGDQDILAGNHGTNSFFKAPVRLYVKDFDSNGTLEYFYCINREGKFYPVADRNELISQLPGLKKRILYFKDYASMTIDDLFIAEELKDSRILEVNTLSSTLFINENGNFVSETLPWQLQLAPIYAIEATESNTDGLALFFGGNQYLVKPQFGRFDALPLSIWHIEKNQPNWVEQTGYFSQIRGIQILNYKNNKYVITASTNDELAVFKYY